MKRVLLIGLLILVAGSAKADVCDDLRGAILGMVQAGSPLMDISRGANQAYPLVGATNPHGKHCKYVRYSFRILRKPYRGKNISQADLERAIRMLVNRTEF